MQKAVDELVVNEEYAMMCQFCQLNSPYFHQNSPYFHSQCKQLFHFHSQPGAHSFEHRWHHNKRDTCSVIQTAKKIAFCGFLKVNPQNSPAWQWLATANHCQYTYTHTMTLNFHKLDKTRSAFL